MNTVDGVVHGFGFRNIALKVHLVQSDIGDYLFPETDQVHGNAVRIISGDEEGKTIFGDSFITDKAGVVCFVRSADCTPILIVDSKKRAVAAVHAGWRGTAKNVVGETVLAMQKKFGCAPVDLAAAIGPRICGKCYEVGVEVVGAMSWMEKRDWMLDEKHVDLGVANKAQLEASGLSSANIELFSDCTRCDKKFASFRRDGTDAERQFSFVAITKS